MKSSKTTRRALLGSLTSLVLCFAMLIGSTFAWFTDSASTSVNTIQAGKLGVTIEMSTDGQTWTSAEGETLDFVKAAGHESETILWEPGASYNLPLLRIRNNENLALKYKVAITAAQGEQNNKLAEVLDVTVKVGDTTLPSVGTLKDVLAQNMDTYIVNNVLEAGQDSGAIAISMKMQETADNAYQGLSVGKIAITVYATQATVEHDSTTDQYDANADFPMVWDGTSTQDPTVDPENANVYRISTAAQLMGLMEDAQGGGASVYTGKQIILENDIDLGGATVKGFGNEGCIFGGSFDGQNHTISNFVIERVPATPNTKYYAGLFNYYSFGTIKDLNVKGATIIGDQMVGALVGGLGDNASIENCTVSDCTVVGYRKVGGAVGYATGATVSGCEVTNTNVFCAVNEQSHGLDQWGEVIGYKNTGLTESGNTATNVNVYRGVSNLTLVSSAADFAALATKNSMSNIVITSNIDMAGQTWTGLLGGTQGQAFVSSGVTIYGNGHTITGLTAPLVAATTYPVTINDLTIKNANISSSSDYAGAFVAYMDASPVALKNCHLVDSTIASNKYAGMIGWATGGVTAENCTVNKCEITAGGSVGTIVGHTTESATLTNCKILGATNVKCTENREGSAAKAGWFVGTVNGGTTTLTGCTNSSTGTLTNNNAEAPLNGGLIGRNVGGTVTIA